MVLYDECDETVEERERLLTALDVREREAVAERTLSEEEAGDSGIAGGVVHTWSASWSSGTGRLHVEHLTVGRSWDMRGPESAAGARSRGIEVR